MRDLDSKIDTAPKKKTFDPFADIDDDEENDSSDSMWDFSDLDEMDANDFDEYIDELEKAINELDKNSSTKSGDSETVKVLRKVKEKIEEERDKVKSSGDPFDLLKKLW